MKTTQRIQLKAGLINGIASWYVDNPTTLEATIKEGSVVLQNDKVILENPSSIEKVMAFGDGLKCYVQFVSISLIGTNIRLCMVVVLLLLDKSEIQNWLINISLQQN